MKRLSQVTSTFLLMAAVVPFGFAQATNAVNATTNTAANAAATASANTAAAAAAQQQAANAATAAAGRAQGAVNASTTAATNAANATTAAAQNAAANANLAASTAAQNAAAAGASTAGTNVAGSVGSSTTATTGVRAGSTPSANISAGTATAANGQVSGQAGSLSVSSLASQGASASLNSDTVVSQIRNTSGTTRDRVTGEVQMRLDASMQAVGSAEAKAAELRGEAKARFQDAVTQVRRAEQRVRTDLRELRNAAADKINSERSQLADSYEVYARAVADLEVAGQVNANH